MNAILRWILGPLPYDAADGQKHWDETADALARIEEGTLPCPCIEHARYHLSRAQKLNEIEGMAGHAFFTLGCAINSLINHIDGKHDPE